MRWRITTENSIETKDENNRITKIKHKKKIRRLYISVGDIVGMGKSAVGAVQRLAKNLPKFINSFKNMSKSETAAAMGINAVTQNLAIILEGNEKFKKVMGIIETLTPIVKTIASATGVWCSPGNAAELGQLALGIGEKILIAIVTEAIFKLKDMIWNYEFQIKEISKESSMIISSHLKKFMKLMNKKQNIKTEDDEDINDEDDIDIEDNYYTDIFNKEDDHSNEKEIYDKKNGAIKEEINKIFSEEYDNIGPDLKTISGILYNDESVKPKVDYYKTEFIESGHKDVRLLHGTKNDKGILFSDDNGETWEMTNQDTGSFEAFAKIKVNDNWRYIAGYTYGIKTIKSTEDTSMGDCIDISKHYKKDYYSLSGEKLTKEEKNKIFLKYNFDEAKANKLINDKSEYQEALGILYSDDNGITWNKSSIEIGSFGQFFEFQEKVGHPARVVASSYDYKGVYYTEDGKNWNRSVNKENEPIETDRWVFYVDSDNELNNKVSGKNIEVKVDIPKYFLNTTHIFNENKINLNTLLNIESYQGEEFKNYNPALTGPIIDYIHYNYSDRLPKYSEDFWFDLINKINEGKYTMENAINGDGLEVE